jgi:tetratricopeptide (TPR) repeat protein
MKTILLCTLLTAVLLLQGCSSVKSDISYRKGTEKLWNGEAEQAVAYLNEAIKLDPKSARNHYHLAIAYQRLGHITQAWEHIRHAYLLDSKSQPQMQVFTRVYEQLAQQHRLEKSHPSASSVVDILGVGDKYLHDEQGELQAIYYGPLCLHFEHGHLASSEWYPR